MTARASSPTEPGPSAARALIGRPSRWAALYTGLLFAPFAVISVVAKALKYAALSETGGPLEAIAVLAPDVGLAVLVVALGAAFLSAGATAVRATALWTLHLLAPVLAAAAVFEHGFFAVTGSVIDAHVVIEYGLQLDQVKGVIWSELSPVRQVGLVSPFAASIGLFAAARTAVAARVRRALERGSSWRRWQYRAAGGLAGALVLLGLGSSSLSLPPDVAPLSQSFVWGLSRDLAIIALEQSDHALVPEVDPVAPVRWEKRRPAKAKNVVTIVLESTGAKRTSVYEPSLRNTPFLETLAKRGAVVEEAYTVVPHTTKALISIHCGVYPKLTPRAEEATAAGIPTRCLADVLRGEGFATAFFQTAEENYERRLDLVRRFGFASFTGKESIDGRGFDESSYFGWEDDALIGPVLEWVDRQDDRFYLSVLTLAAHHPYNVPKGFPRTPLSTNKELDDYLNTVAYTDRFLEKLFAGFEERGLLEDTLFILVGDHGEAFGEHGRKQHDTTLHEEGIHVPMLLVGAGVEAGTRVRGPRQIIDVLPTALGHLGYESDDDVMGRSVLLHPPHEQLFFSCQHRSYCMGLRRGSMKYIYNYKKRGAEVYDLSADPLEKENLYHQDDGAREEMAQAAAAMKRIRERTLAEYHAQQDAATQVFVKRERPSSIPRPMDLDFEGAVKLIGWDLDHTEIVAGQKAVITLYYEVLDEVPAAWRPFLHLGGPQFINADHVPLEGAYPLREWRAGDFVIDRHTLTTRPLSKPGEYEITTGFWRKDGRIAPEGSGATLAEDGAVRLGTLRIRKPALDVDAYVSTVAPTEPATLDVRFGDFARARAVSVDRLQVKAGLKTTLTVTYEVLQDPEQELSFEVRIEGPSKKPVLGHVPLNGALPVAAWRSGQFIRDPLEIVTHTKDSRAEYTVKLRLVDESGEAVPAWRDGDPAPGGLVEIGRYTVVR